MSSSTSGGVLGLVLLYATPIVMMILVLIGLLLVASGRLHSRLESNARKLDRLLEQQTGGRQGSDWSG